MSLMFSCSMFFLSFTPLWISVVFIDVVNLLTTKSNLWTEEISVACIIIGFVISGIILIRYIKHVRPNVTKTYTIVSAKEEKTISLEFLLAYVMPLFAFDFTQWKQTILFLHIFIVLCWLCVKHKYFINNVVLEALKFNIYSCILDSEDHKKLVIKVISRERLALAEQHDIKVEFVNNDFAMHR